MNSEDPSHEQLSALVSFPASPYPLCSVLSLRKAVTVFSVSQDYILVVRLHVLSLLT